MSEEQAYLSGSIALSRRAKQSLCINMECGWRITTEQFKSRRMSSFFTPCRYLCTWEIVPLNVAGNILGAEDNGPSKKWIALIGQTLNSGPGTSGGNGCYTCSPVPDPIAEWNADFEGSSRYKASSFSHGQSFQTPQCGILENDPSILQPRMDGRYSGCD